MTTAYLDTSAAMKLIIEEDESDALVQELATRPGRRLASSWLLHVELHGAAGRHPAAIGAGEVRAVLETVNLVDLTRGDLISAGTHAPLRSHDAMHLAVALRLGVDELFTYDQEMADIATRAGLRVVAPAA